VTTLTSATRTLAEVADHPRAAVATVTIPGDPDLDVVVLGRLTAGMIEVFAGGSVQSYPDTTPVTDIFDPERRVGLLTSAAFVLDQERRELARQITAERTRHAEVLRDIRDYAIARYCEEMYCIDGLNTFLRYFDLPEYRPSTRVSFTIHGSYRTERSDTDDAEDDAANSLAPDLSGVSYVIEGSADYHVAVDEVEELDC
jgi:hypothetical protein